MKNISHQDLLTNVESDTVYNNCTFYLGEKQSFAIANSYFRNCGFYNSGLFTRLENSFFHNCEFIGKFALEITNKSLIHLSPDIGNLSFLTHLTVCAPLESLPEEIKKLSNLQELNLHQCCFTQLPKQIGDLDSLITLNLSGCRITSLPKEIHKLTHLRHLNLNATLCAKLPRQIGSLSNLRHLHMWDMSLDHLPIEMSNLKQLEYAGGSIRSSDKILLQALLPKCNVVNVDEEVQYSSTNLDVRFE